MDYNSLTFKCVLHRFYELYTCFSKVKWSVAVEAPSQPSGGKGEITKSSRPATIAQQDPLQTKQHNNQRNGKIPPGS